MNVGRKDKFVLIDAQIDHNIGFGFPSCFMKFLGTALPYIPQCLSVRYHISGTWQCGLEKVVDVALTKLHTCLIPPFIFLLPWIVASLDSDAARRGNWLIIGK